MELTLTGTGLIQAHLPRIPEQLLLMERYQVKILPLMVLAVFSIMFPLQAPAANGHYRIT